MQFTGVWKMQYNCITIISILVEIQWTRIKFNQISEAKRQVNVKWLLYVFKLYQTETKSTKTQQHRPCRADEPPPPPKIGGHYTWKFSAAMTSMTMIFQWIALEALGQSLAWFHRLHWMMSVPALLCSLASLLVYSIISSADVLQGNVSFVTSVTDDFFQ